jgi:hypothetical protein
MDCPSDAHLNCWFTDQNRHRFLRGAPIKVQGKIDFCGPAHDGVKRGALSGMPRRMVAPRWLLEQLELSPIYDPRDRGKGTA